MMLLWHLRPVAATKNKLTLDVGILIGLKAVKLTSMGCSVTLEVSRPVQSPSAEGHPPSVAFSCMLLTVSRMLCGPQHKHLISFAQRNQL